MSRRPQRYTLFPYATLFRSRRAVNARDHADLAGDRPDLGERAAVWPAALLQNVGPDGLLLERAEHLGHDLLVVGLGEVGQRSEEHTSELQSRQYLVCRLLLE